MRFRPKTSNSAPAGQVKRAICGRIIIAPEYRPAAAGCRSRGAPSALRVVVSCQSSVVSGSWQSEELYRRAR